LDITFPSQIEVRINQDEVKANYKGLKNKPGSTRPADITSLLRTTPANYRNSITITYALTHKASTAQVSYPLPLLSHMSLILTFSVRVEVQHVCLLGAQVLGRRIGQPHQATQRHHQSVGFE
jgi:hypothetical protein